MTDPDFEILRPHAHTIAATQAAWIQGAPNQPEKALEGDPDRPAEFNDAPARNALAWADACRRYIVPKPLQQAQPHWMLTMHYPEHIRLVINHAANPVTPHLRDIVLDGLRQRAGLRPHRDQNGMRHRFPDGTEALEIAEGATITCTQTGCEGTIRPGHDHCPTCRRGWWENDAERCTRCSTTLTTAAQIETGRCTPCWRKQATAPVVPFMDQAPDGTCRHFRIRTRDGGRTKVCDTCGTNIQ